jgi:lipopolysaccharide/colanic/teichoic acid biosynthesis glycosyltransferase
MRRGARLLMYLGTIVTVLAWGKYHATSIGHYNFTGSFRFAWSLAYIALLCLSAYGIGLPDLPRGLRAALISSLGAAAAAALGISVAQLVFGSLLLPRFVVAASALVLIPFYGLCARLSAGGRARQEERDKVVAVVTPDEAVVLADDLSRHPERPASLTWVLRLDEAQAPHPDQLPLVDTVDDVGATVVVLDRAAQNDDTVVAQAAVLHERGVRVRTLPLFYDEWLGKLPISELERVSLMFDIGEVHRARYGRLKRLGDLIIGVASFVPLAVVTPVVFMANLIGNRGPVFYTQTRVGKNGAPFTIIKFRTMRPGEGPAEWTQADDPRVTRFGRWLRLTHLDELPQAVNIVRGDLAIVGPRPEQPQYVDELTEKIPFYNLRHLVRPGLTGWAQVKYAYGASDIDAVEKLQYEFYYLRHQGFTLDARIIGRTIRSVVERGGR